MSRLWQYLSNQFLNETVKNFLKALKLAEFTDAALSTRTADAFFNAQYVIFHPLYVALNDAFDAWDTQKGTQKGKTASVEEVLDDLSANKINQWDVAAQAAGVLKGSPNYIALLPRGHKPFQTGENITRINTVNSFSSAIALQIPPLAPPTHPLVILKNDVDTFYTLASDAYTSQQGEISDTGTDSDEVDAARVNAMVGLYAFLGACMNQFASNPIVIEPLFNLELLRQHKQMLFKGHAVVSKVHTVVERTLAPDAMLRLTNTGVTVLQFYLAAVAGAHPNPFGSKPLTVEAGTEVTVPASTLGDVKADHYLIVLNPDLINKGEWEVEFL